VCEISSSTAPSQTAPNQTAPNQTAPNHQTALLRLCRLLCGESLTHRPRQAQILLPAAPPPFVAAVSVSAVNIEFHILPRRLPVTNFRVSFLPLGPLLRYRLRRVRSLALDPRGLSIACITLRPWRGHLSIASRLQSVTLGPQRGLLSIACAVGHHPWTSEGSPVGGPGRRIRTAAFLVIHSLVLNLSMLTPFLSVKKGRAINFQMVID